VFWLVGCLVGWWVGYLGSSGPEVCMYVCMYVVGGVTIGPL